MTPRQSVMWGLQWSRCLLKGNASHGRGQPFCHRPEAAAPNGRNFAWRVDTGSVTSTTSVTPRSSTLSRLCSGHTPVRLPASWRARETTLQFDRPLNVKLSAKQTINPSWPPFHQLSINQIRNVQRETAAEGQTGKCRFESAAGPATVICCFKSISRFLPFCTIQPSNLRLHR